MLVLFIAIGAVVGFWLFEELSGAVVGALIGYLAAELSALKQRVRALEGGAPKEEARAMAPPAGPTLPRPAPPMPPERAAQPAAAAQTPPPPSVRSAPARAAERAPSGPVSAAPTLFDQALHVVKEFFTGGNTVVRVGVIVLFFGVAFLLKYAAEHARLPIEFRLSGVALGAMALLYIGLRVRRKREGYGLTLEGAAIGILALTIFAAFRIYGLLPASLAFALLFVAFASCVALALVQNALVLAVFGVAGGFLAPVLASTGTGSHVPLFGYYALLNIAILTIAWFKAWRLLNLLGFGFTFVIGAAWGYRYYQPEFFASTEPFLVFFFLLYATVAVLFAKRQAPTLRDPVDGTLVFGVPIVGFLLQAALVKNYEYGLAWSAFALGAFYLALARIGLTGWLPKLLSEAFVALGVIFVTLTIPLAVDGHWTAAAWAIEGAGVLWIGLRQSRLLAQVFGMIVQIGAGVFFLSEMKTPIDIPVLNSAYVGAVLLAIAGLVTAYLLMRRYADSPREEPKFAAVAFLVWGLVWWYGGAFNEVQRHVASRYELSTWLFVIAATTLVQYLAATRWAWVAMRYAALANLGLLFLTLLVMALDVSHPFAGWGAIAWPLAFAIYYGVLRRVEGGTIAQVQTAAHAGALWLLVGVLGWELHWAVSRHLSGDWAAAALGVVAAGALLAIDAGKARGWPVEPHRRAYLLIGAVPVALLAAIWLAGYGIAEPGNPTPLAYLPVINPLDLTALLILLALSVWGISVGRLTTVSGKPVLLAVGVAAFVWANAALFRAIHHFAGVGYTLDAMVHSVLAQSSLSIFWTVLAFVLMLAATRLRQRDLWLTGGALLAVVVVKLFLVDLSNTGTVARIISFVGVGVLLLLIGYLVPVPPKPAARQEAAS